MMRFDQLSCSPQVADAAVEGMHLRTQRAEEDKPGNLTPAEMRDVHTAVAGV